MKLATQLIAIAAGIGATVAFETWTTSDSGPRSKAHYAAVVSASQGPRDRAIAFGLKAFGDGQPAEAVRSFFAADAIDHAAPGVVGAEALAARAGEIEWLKPGTPRKQVQVAGERDLAFVRYAAGPDGAQDRVEIYRIKAGKIVEHWSVVAAQAATAPAAKGA